MDPKWRMEMWEEYAYNKNRDIDRTFKFKEIVGYSNADNQVNDGEEMPTDYDASSDDEHTNMERDDDEFLSLTAKTLRHNIMHSYLEVSEWLGDGATQYGSHNGYVSRKMSLRWLFCAVRALINWKLNNQERYADRDIHPLDIDEHHEHFLSTGELSDCNISYDDPESLN